MVKRTYKIKTVWPEMQTMQNREDLLHGMYKKREILDFIYGEEYFELQVLALWKYWKSVPDRNFSESMPGLDNEVIEMICWEEDNGYTRRKKNDD